MISVNMLSLRREVQEALPRCLQLARDAGCTLPVQYPSVPLLWWDLFNNLDGTDFNAKRGTNFLGVRSRLGGLHLLLAMRGPDLAGFLPVVSYQVTLPGQDSPVRIFTLPGDYQLISRQDFTVAPGERREAVHCLMEALAGLIEDDGDAVVLPHLAEDSPNLPDLREALAGLSRRGFRIAAARTGRRGGVRAWTTDSVLSCLRQLLDRDLPAGSKESAASLISDLASCPPMNLLFAKTRRGFEERVRGIVDAIPGTGAWAGPCATLDGLLQDAPAVYPVIRLPDNRQAYLDTLGKSWRKNSRNLRKKFTNNGGSFEEVLSGSVTARDVDDYLALHALRWGDSSASLRSEATHSFHRGLLRILSSEGFLTLHYALHEGKRVATCSCIDILDRREAYLSGRDPSYDQWSASRLLIMETILDSIDKGFSLYDLGLGWFAYKMSFSKNFITTWNFFVTPGGRTLDLDRLYVGYECMLPS